MGNIHSKIGSTNTGEGAPLSSWSVSDDSQFQIPAQSPEEANAQAQAQYEAQMRFQADAQTQAQQPRSMAQMPVDMPQDTRIISDASGAELMEMRRKMIDRANSQQLNQQTSNARDRIAFLTGIGKNTLDVEIEYAGPDGNSLKSVFTLRTLKGREMKRLAMKIREVQESDSGDGTFQVRALALGQALSSIDGANIDMVLGIEGRDEQQRLAVRMAFVEEIDEHVASYVYARFNQMTSDAVQKYSIKTEEDVEEVAEAIKKSSAGAGQ